MLGSKRAARLALEAGHAGAHDLVDEQQVGRNHRAGVDHLPLHPGKTGKKDGQGLFVISFASLKKKKQVKKK